MNERMQDRLETLRSEYEKGHEHLRDLRRQEAQVQETLLRIDGAIRVLQELLEHETTEGETGIRAVSSAAQDREVA